MIRVSNQNSNNDYQDSSVVINSKDKLGVRLKAFPSNTNVRPPSQFQSPMAMNQNNKNSAESLVNNSALDGSVHIGQDDKHHEKSLMTHISQEAEVEINQLKKVIEDLNWKIDYEKGLSKEMTQLLEKKVSQLMAQINTYSEEE